MRDFTLEAYRLYLKAIQSSYSNIFTFADFFSLPEHPDSFAIIRHDVDRKPKNALKMARIEYEMGIRSTYYFRTRNHVFKPGIIAEIATAGHEIGYHYENLSDAKGEFQTALQDFELNLEKLRKIVPIHTIAMHGSPMSPHDNRDMWGDPETQKYLKNSLEIYGEVYLDIEYSDIAYITDTGRNWSADRANRRDTVVSTLSPEFKNGRALLDCFEKAGYPKVVLQIHPERWADAAIEYFVQSARDWIANSVKSILQ